jgi:Flp pilus assembly protein TadD
MKVRRKSDQSEWMPVSVGTIMSSRHLEVVMNGPAIGLGRSIRRAFRAFTVGWFVSSVLGNCIPVSAAPQSAEHGSSARDLIQEGEALVRQGRLAEAEAVLDGAESLSPTDVEMLTLLDKIKGRLDQFPEAVTLFQRVIQLSPNSAEGYVNLATAHLNRGRILDDLRREREAAAEFALARRFAPNDLDVYYYWSLVEHAEGNCKKHFH